MRVILTVTGLVMHMQHDDTITDHDTRSAGRNDERHDPAPPNANRGPAA
ncbi:hypothetical protein [Jiangella gansuensis]|nr:hypothetical protein [Jiangella gansuensis]